MNLNNYENFIEEHLKLLDAVLTKPSGQFMLVSPDTTILSDIVASMKHKDYKSVNKKNYTFVEVKRQRDEHPENKIFILNLTNDHSMEYQSLLYFYFELPLHSNCFVCILTTSSTALNILEKRVMSRFKNRIFFIPYYKNKYTKEEDKPMISSSLNAQKQSETMEKYKLEHYSLPFMLSLFEPVHMVLMMVSFAGKLDKINAYNQFKLAVANTPELKKTEATRVLQCAMDIFDSDLVNDKGIPLIDYNEFKSYIKSEGSLYLKKLMHEMKNK